MLLERTHFTLTVRTRYQTLHEREHSALFSFEHIANATRTHAFLLFPFKRVIKHYTDVNLLSRFCSNALSNATRTPTFCFIHVRTRYQMHHECQHSVSAPFERVIKCSTNARILSHFISFTFLTHPLHYIMTCLL